jgi:hypothetical protein
MSIIRADEYVPLTKFAYLPVTFKSYDERAFARR